MIDELVNKRKRLLRVLAAGLVVVVLLAVVTSLGRIESTLTDRSIEALQAAQIGGVEVQFSGRAATLSGGPLEDEEIARAVAIVQETEGVRSVDGEAVAPLTTTTTSTSTTTTTTIPTPDDGRITIFFNGDGTFRFEGFVPDDQTKRAIEEAAYDVFGEGNVESALTVDFVYGFDWDFPAIFRALLNGAIDVGARSSIRDGEPFGAVGLKGFTSTNAARTDAIERIQSAIGDNGVVVADTLIVGSVDQDVLLGMCRQALEQVVADQTVEFEPVDDERLVVAESSLEFVTDLADLMQPCDFILGVNSFTDDQASEEDSLELSEERGDAVIRALGDLGINRRQIAMVGFGAAEPIADNETEEGRLANNRIEFNFQGGE